MTEADFIAGYDPTGFPRLSLAVDVVALFEHNGALNVLLVRRAEHPARGKLALPGTFVGPAEELEEAARRALRAKAGIDVPMRQFRTFGAVDRDPRMRIVSVGYMALMTTDQLPADGIKIVELTPRGLRSEAGRKIGLAFDHDQIVAAALDDLRFHLDHSDWAFGLLREEFTLRELQLVHEAIRGESLNKPAFRKRLLDSRWLEPTGRKEANGPYRPAELYRLRKENK